MLRSLLHKTFTRCDRVLANQRTELKCQFLGIVKFIGQGIARVAGLPGVKSEEVVQFRCNEADFTAIANAAKNALVDIKQKFQ